VTTHQPRDIDYGQKPSHLRAAVRVAGQEAAGGAAVPFMFTLTHCSLQVRCGQWHCPLVRRTVARHVERVQVALRLSAGDRPLANSKGGDSQSAPPRRASCGLAGGVVTLSF